MTHYTRRVASGLAVAVALCVALVPGQSQAQVRVLDDGPIHEAFVPPVTGVTALEAIAKEPPPPIVEKVPAKCDPEAIWIQGYFAYNEEIDDFNYVGGCWRKPPRGLVWVDGFWQEFPEGWVWIRGFWSPKPAAELVYTDEAPPDPLDEDPPVSPGANYFWLAGYFEWKPSGYVRYSGRWMEMDPDLILVPATNIWRPEGYASLRAYWDWPIDKRGCTYQSIYIEPAARVSYVYEPVVIVEPAVVIGWCYYSYPDYGYFLHHHYHHHHAWWHDHYDVPTWWGWHGWWAFSWHDHWGLWWWYGHPGYPAPLFMTASYAAMIHPPSEKFVFKSKTIIKAPKIVTDKGVITPKESLELAKKGKGKAGDDKKGKFSPVIAATTKSKDKDDKDDKKGDKKDDGKIASTALLPTGTESAKKDDDDPKKHPPKPKSGKTASVVASPSGVGKSTPTITKSGDSKGKAKDDDKDKPKGKTGGPPITTKATTSDSGSKGKGKDDDKDKMKSKTGGPPITTKSSSSGGDSKSKGTDKPKGKDKDDDKPGDKPKDKDKDKDVSPKKSGGSSPPTPSPGDLKPKDKDKPPKGDDKPGAAKPGDSKPPSTPGTSGGGKDKDKDDKKKDKK